MDSLLPQYRMPEPMGTSDPDPEARCPKHICPYCGTNPEAEREVFSQDKLFTEHNCKGGENGKNN